MELSPRLYHYFVRPKWFLNKFYNSMFQNCIEFKDKTVLDFGCGIGSSSYLFESSNYLGVDCDDKRINYAKKLYPEYNFITTKDGLLPLSQNSVDYIMILSVLHHIPTEELTDSLKEFKRVLKSDGNIIIVEPCFFKKARMRNWYMSKLDKGTSI
ncbi:ubiquinone/menaquinone biosynthesis C-methylase UbiE [Clostridium tetanomorphum]|uniref:class I SAM-dependent methyltransferase n=1 Tax=Clostridium tetanomorphum TaxID=1553 RepID=UPI00044D9CF3|nr:class I SAM-dependent methyltransferase [Clostridium tetanomorphum]KAJ49234.1 putative type 11 methyltransferase [Clostridium tetanomorphum DSM 665]KAJ50371.1 putative type 11 methyltransferase [Clostridium tetanomorphum DSM 665]MBP1865817.1 ubiquinone/menaquinone biosynthesis C-methylase UbiE [Clostridium tetanomorphum]NRS86937.1 ubiquinone/menaquinone biosynthesis C-methylase UbiE [Clostridium tetanomorphum]SQC00260.1 putative type 11 methyltransferase [Clostridium tetanomorphum]